MGIQGYDDESSNESVHFRPDAWNAAWEAAQDVLAPSPAVKRAAERVVLTEVLQQVIGWLLLTQFGILLGSFGQIMSQPVCLLSWGIFMLEAGLKLGRSWAHTNFFKDVPCAYVPIHQEAVHNSLAFFAKYLVSATLLEVVLYVPYLSLTVRLWHSSRSCYHLVDDTILCPQGVANLLDLLVISCGIVICHWVSSLLAVLAFNAAMGSRLFRLLRLKWDGKKVKGDHDRLLCLTWWVHVARHRHLSAAVASTQIGACGLPGHWFESAWQLRRIVSESTRKSDSNALSNSAGPACVAIEMALRALVSLAKQGHLETGRQILRNNGFETLLQIVSEGKPVSFKGLAASVIAVLATNDEIMRDEHVDLASAVIPLKRLARSKEVELKEVALGALLNAALSHEQSSEVLSKLMSSDELSIGNGKSSGSFVTQLMLFAQNGPTVRCQELAAGLLARLACKRPARNIMMQIRESDNVNGIELFITLLKSGLTAEMRASAAGILSEIAYWDGRALGSGPFGRSCIEGLVGALKCETEVAAAAAGALASLGFRNKDNKLMIVQCKGIEGLVELLKKKEILEFDPPGEMDDRARADSPSQLMEIAQAEAARALWVLAIDIEENKKHIVEQRAIGHLAKLLMRERPKVHMQAAAALGALAFRNRATQDCIGQEHSEVIPRLVHLLNPTIDSNMLEAVLEKVVLAVRNIADGNKGNREMFLNAGAENHLQKILELKERFRRGRGPTSKVCDLATKTLDILNKRDEGYPGEQALHDWTFSLDEEA